MKILIIPFESVSISSIITNWKVCTALHCFALWPTSEVAYGDPSVIAQAIGFELRVRPYARYIRGPMKTLGVNEVSKRRKGRCKKDGRKLDRSYIFFVYCCQALLGHCSFSRSPLSSLLCYKVVARIYRTFAVVQGTPVAPQTVVRILFVRVCHCYGKKRVELWLPSRLISSISPLADWLAGWSSIETSFPMSTNTNLFCTLLVADSGHSNFVPALFPHCSVFRDEGETDWVDACDGWHPVIWLPTPGGRRLHIQPFYGCIS